MAKQYIPSARILRLLSHPASPEPKCPSQRCQRTLTTYMSHQTPIANPSRRTLNHYPTHRALTTTTTHTQKQYLTPEYTHNRRRDGELQPRPLSRPLGLPYPPKPGQNTGRDTRTWRQKRDDFASYERHKARQAQIVSDVFERYYWRDVGNLGKEHKGKSMLAPTTPFKSGVALYFPNLEGMTLEGAGVGLGKCWKQTGERMRGRISLVSMIHTDWADSQTRSFLAAEENPALHQYLEGHDGAKKLVQQVTVNVEENPLKALMVQLFFGRLRRQVGKARWGTYFLNRRGLSEEIRDALAMWNSKVGYVYLVDGQCRIRWASNGFARPEEKESLVRCVRRLVDEAQGVQRGLRREEPKRPSGTVKKEEAVPKKQVLAAS